MADGFEVGQLVEKQLYYNGQPTGEEPYYHVVTHIDDKGVWITDYPVGAPDFNLEQPMHMCYHPQTGWELEPVFAPTFISQILPGVGCVGDE